MGPELKHSIKSRTPQEETESSVILFPPVLHIFSCYRLLPIYR